VFKQLPVDQVSWARQIFRMVCRIELSTTVWVEYERLLRMRWRLQVIPAISEDVHESKRLDFPIKLGVEK
jgi:hypothetical protein